MSPSSPIEGRRPGVSWSGEAIELLAKRLHEASEPLKWEDAAGWEREVARKFAVAHLSALTPYVMPVEEHEAAMNNAHHERNFWSWKYERRETECEELAKQVAKPEACRNWIDAKNNHCNKSAKYIVWGKLFPEDHLGPRCEDCAHDQVGYDALRPDGGYAIHHLPDPTQPNPIGDRATCTCHLLDGPHNPVHCRQLIEANRAGLKEAGDREQLQELLEWVEERLGDPPAGGMFDSTPNGSKAGLEDVAQEIANRIRADQKGSE